ncbi:MAG: zinc-binding dehydrogenase [Dehalococcoidia bacterium]
MSGTGLRAVVPGERQVSFEQFELPAALGPRELLVRLERTVISAGTETANYTALDPGVHVPGNWNTYPWRPGYGGVGTVIARGAAVSYLQTGDRVYGIFHHATHEVVDAGRDLCLPVPAGLEPTPAVMARMGNVAITARQRSRAMPGDGVAVIGLGVVGNLAGQFFAADGFRVAGIDPQPRRRSAALACGFSAVIDPASLAAPVLAERLADALGRPPRVIIDAVGDSAIVAGAVAMAPRNGEVILLGTPRAPRSGDLTGLLNRVHAMGIELIGALEWNIPLLGRDRLSTERNAGQVLAMVAEGRLAVEPLVSHELPPSGLQEAYEGLLTRRDDYLGVVLDWTRA